MKGKLKSIILGWLVHFAGVTVVMNLLHIYKYITDTLYQGRTPWEYFVYHTFQDIDTLILAICLLYIEINYQYYFNKLRLLLFMASCLVVGLVGSVTFTILQNNSHKGMLAGVNQLLIIATYALLYSIVRNYLHQMLYGKSLQLQQAKNELDALKAQINPHFLFNSLNYLYGSALSENAPNTADGIDKLSGMMRYTITGLHENFVAIKEEFNFIENYLSVQQARLPKRDNIRIDIEIPSTLPDAQIAPLLMLPLIENAFKYGISMDEPCFVSIKIEIAGKKLLVDIANSIVKGPIDTKGNNTGVSNTIKRLKLLYGHNYDLKQMNDGQRYQTMLQIVLNP